MSVMDKRQEQTQSEVARTLWLVGPIMMSYLLGGVALLAYWVVSRFLRRA
jgi:hypothetical protein